MKKLSMVLTRPTIIRRVLIPAILVAISALEINSAEAHYVVRPNPGGLSPTPDITSMVSSNNEVTVKWNGFGGPYQLEKLPFIGGQWQQIGSPTTEKQMVVPGADPHAIFRLRAPAPGYAGAETCAECHGTTAHHWSQSRHANALQTLSAIGMAENASCVKCHTVGAGFSTGFQSQAATPFFAGVQCESCHGPAAAHANNPDDLFLRPIITQSENLCGGCHEGEHHPTFSEWKTSLHARVDPHVREYFEDPKSGIARMNACGACHSGAVRRSMMKTVGGSALELPSGHEAASTGITCSTCHSSHQSTASAASLRHPQFSTNFFTYSTATNTTFAAQYKQEVQICAQCHNTRGATPNDTSRPPHHSPQYNILIGDIGPDYAPQIVQSAHTRLEKQCSSCHVHRTEPEVVSAENPVYTGHDFAPNSESCTKCHQTAARADGMVATLQADIKAQIAEIKQLLETWSETKAPEAIRTKYGKLGWEYTSPGQISNPTGATMAGPSSTEQRDLPAEIKKARMWVYLVEHDGSYGVHNPKYARFLLGTARTNITTLLAAP